MDGDKALCALVGSLCVNGDNCTFDGFGRSVFYVEDSVLANDYVKEKHVVKEIYKYLDYIFDENCVTGFSFHDFMRFPVTDTQFEFSKI